MPIGTLFPPNTPGEQTMAASATNVQVSNPQVSQQPQQLPTTAGASDISGLLIGLALALVIAGSALRLRFTRH